MLLYRQNAVTKLQTTKSQEATEMATKAIQHSYGAYGTADERREGLSVWAKVREFVGPVADYFSSMFMAPGLEILDPAHRSTLTVEEKAKVDAAFLSIG